jgi:hypothetical protein
LTLDVLRAHEDRCASDNERHDDSRRENRLTGTPIEEDGHDQHPPVVLAPADIGLSASGLQIPYV